MPVQPAIKESAMSIIDAENLIFLIALQSLNAAAPTLDMLSGIIIPLASATDDKESTERLVHFSNADSPIFVRLISTVLTLSSEITIFSITTLPREVHPKNAPSPISVIDAGMETHSRVVQDAKA